MNSLSWFLYFAGAVDRLTVVMALTLGAVLIFSVICGMVIAFSFDGYNDQQRQAGALRRKTSYGLLRKSLPCAALIAVFIALTPNKTTLYLIAASEIGQQLAQTEAVSEISKEAYDALRSYLKNITNELKPEKK